ncbi:hypothetical protein CY0110_15567 [Crocosphaera chwakensis CCY0110]|uniref:Uncharacterized protein n=1 Tax=Crocosphaera chwakensis CCY0110 TaxID=391612 RepID=A3IHE5_9CHRO|nr:hypothetical protein CY0110_15567 [Crocosphaera chwakensis CCY0110]
MGKILTVVSTPECKPIPETVNPFSIVDVIFFPLAPHNYLIYFNLSDRKTNLFEIALLPQVKSEMIKINRINF